MTETNLDKEKVIEQTEIQVDTKPPKPLLPISHEVVLESHDKSI